MAKLTLNELLTNENTMFKTYFINISAFNTNGIVYDNTPWRPGRDMDLVDRPVDQDDRKLKNLATRIMSNGVEVLVKDKSSDGKLDQVNLLTY